MRFPSLVLALAGAMLMTGCSSLVSLNPFVTDKDAVLDNALAGVWTGDNGGEIYVIRRDGAGYAIAYMDQSSQVIEFQARLMKAGEVELLDLVSTNQDPFQIPVHHVVRVWPTGNSLRMAFLDTGWLKQQTARQLTTTTTDDRLLITAPGEAVRAFLTKFGADERAYTEPGILQRVQ